VLTNVPTIIQQTFFNNFKLKVAESEATGKKNHLHERDKPAPVHEGSVHILRNSNSLLVPVGVRLESDIRRYGRSI